MRQSTTGSPFRRSSVSPLKWLFVRCRTSSITRELSHLRLGLGASETRLQVGGLRLFDVGGSGLVRKETFLSKSFGRPLDAGDVLVAGEFLVLLQQSEAAPGLSRRLASVPHAVAVHVDEHLLTVERLEPVAGERRERRGARRAFRLPEIDAERAGELRELQRRVVDRPVAVRVAELRPVRV